MTRKPYKHSEAFLEKQRIKKEQQALLKASELDFRKKSTYSEIKKAVKELTQGIVFDPHKKKEFESLLEERTFKEYVKQVKSTGASTIEDIATVIVAGLGLTNRQADVISMNINDNYINVIKNMIAGGTLNDIKNIQLRDSFSMILKM